MNFLNDVETLANPEPVIQDNFERIDKRLAPVIATETTTARTLDIDDAWTWIRTTNAAAVTVTVPPQATVAWQLATEIILEQAGAGQITVAAGAGVTINTSETLLSKAQFAVLGLKRVAENQWTLTGERQAA